MFLLTNIQSAVKVMRSHFLLNLYISVLLRRTRHFYDRRAKKILQCHEETGL